MEITFPGGKKVNALYKGFIIATDQSKSNGGEASAPAPIDLFLASIGTCAGVYVIRFFEKREISTNGLKMFLETEKDPETGMIKRIKIEIKLPQDFPEKYKDAVVNTARLCTITKHLENPPVVEVSATR